MKKTNVLIYVFLFLVLFSSVYSATFIDDFEKYDYINFTNETSFDTANYPRYNDTSSEILIKATDDWDFGVSAWSQCDSTDHTGIRIEEDNGTFGLKHLVSHVDFNQCHYYEWYLKNNMFVGENATLSYDTFRQGSTRVPTHCVMLVNTTSPYCLIIGNAVGNCVGWRNYCNVTGGLANIAYDECNIMYNTDAVPNGFNQFLDRESVTISSCANYDGNESFDRIVYSGLMSGGLGVVDIGIDNFRMEEIGWIEVINTLPEFTVVVNDSVACRNETTDPTISYTITATDSEGDQIFAGIDIFNYDRTQLFYEEDFVDDAGECAPDYDFFKSVNYVTNMTPGPINNPLGQAFFTLIAPSNNQMIRTRKDDNVCTGYIRNVDNQGSFMILPNEPYRFDSTIILNLELPYNDTKFEVETLNGVGLSLSNTSFNKTIDGILIVRSLGSIIYNGTHDSRDKITLNILLNRSALNDTKDGEVFININFTSQDSPISTNFTAIMFGPAGEFEFTGVRFTSFDTVSFDNFFRNKYWTILDINIIGSNFKINPIWTTDLTGTFTLDSSGTALVDFYITDLEHRDSGEFSTQTISYKVEECAEATFPEQLIDVNLLKGANSIQGGIRAFCSSMEKVVRGQTSTSTTTNRFNFSNLISICGTINFIYLYVLGVVLSLMMMLVFRRFEVFFLYWSAHAIVGNFFLVFGKLTILFISIVSVLTIVGIIVTVLSNQNNQSVGNVN